MEEPGYPPAVSILRNQGLRVVGVPVDDHGIVVEAIPARARLVYVTPSHQYPLGMVMARRRRLELLHWAARSGAAIVEDDYDSEFRHTARPLEPLQRLDRDGRVIYVGTFSKSLSPGLRVGFLVAPRTLLPALYAARQAVDWCPPPATQAALTHFIVDGYLDQHLRRTRRSYAKRHRLMRQALDQFLPAGYRRLPAEAGLHIAVTGPSDPAEPDLAATLRQHGLLVTSLPRSYAFSPPTNGLLLGYAGLPDRRCGPGGSCPELRAGRQRSPGWGAVGRTVGNGLVFAIGRIRWSRAARCPQPDAPISVNCPGPDRCQCSRRPWPVGPMRRA